MIPLKVWLLVMAGTVNSGSLSAVQPHLFVTAQDCQRMVDNAPRFQYTAPIWRCIETTVYVPK